MPKASTIPVAVSVFPDELYPAPRSWTEKAYPKLVHYNKLAKGGHFAAWEQPQTLLRRDSRGLQTTAQIVEDAQAIAAEPASRRPRVVLNPMFNP